MRSDFKAYDIIAIEAGRRCKLDVPDAPTATRMRDDARQEVVAAIAGNEKARKLRDELYVDFERRMRDPGYTGNQVHDWFCKTYGPISRSSIYRARAKLLAGESRIAEIAEEARTFVELADKHGGDAVFAGATRRAGQLYFQLLMELNAEDLAGIKASPAKILQLIDSLGGLQRARAQTELLNQKIAERCKLAKAEIDQAAGKNKDGTVTREKVYQIIDKIMRGEAA